MSARPGPPATVAEAIARAAARLAALPATDARREARLLLAHASGLAPGQLIADPDRRLLPDAAADFQALVGRRLAREPIAYILGEREFWSLSFAVTPAVLVPRPDSETVVEAALAAFAAGAGAGTVLDLGTGSGCLLLAVLSEWPGARGLGIDSDPGAVALARANARRLGLDARARFAVGDWGRAVGARFDLVVANPPYVPSAAIAHLDAEVARHEPRRALDGGGDGLDAYRALVPDLGRLLVPGGVAVLEVGAGQAAAVARLLGLAGLVAVARHLDLAGIARCLSARAPAPVGNQKTLGHCVVGR